MYSEREVNAVLLYNVNVLCKILLLTFLSGFKHHNVIWGCGWLMESGAQLVMSHGQEPGGFMAVQRHQRCQGFLSEWEKAPNLDHAVWMEKLELVLITLINKLRERVANKQLIHFLKILVLTEHQVVRSSDVCFSSQELQAELYVNARHQAGNNKHMFSMADQKNSYHRVEAVTSTCILCWECIRKLKGSRNRNPKKALSSTIP